MSQTGTRAVVVLTLLLQTTAGGNALAQATWADVTSGSGLAKRIADAGRIRVLCSSGLILEIKEPRVRGDTLVGLRAYAADSEAIPVNQVRRVWRQRSAAGTGFVAGFTVGGLAGAVGGVALANLCIFGNCPSPSAGEELGAVIGGALLGGTALGVAGLLIGAPIRTWKAVDWGPAPGVAPVVDGRRIGLRIGF